MRCPKLHTKKDGTLLTDIAICVLDFVSGAIELWTRIFYNLGISGRFHYSMGDVEY